MTFKSFEEFWPYYLSQHENPKCRWLHFVGLTLGFACALLAFLLSPWFLALGLVLGYGLSWIGHFVFEKNKPASFGHFWWSLRADLLMYKLMWLRRL